MTGQSTAAMAQGRPLPAGGAPAPRRYTRDDVLRLGQSGKPWDFLPVASAALRAAPADAGVRFLLAAALGKLGLRTLALEQLALLGPAAAADPAAAALRQALSALPADELTLESRTSLLRGNLAALGPRGADLAPHLARWAERARAEQAYRAADGNIIRRPAANTDPSKWLHAGDHARAAAAFIAQHIAGKPAPMPPYTVEGIDPPWLLAGIARATPRDAAGFQPRLTVLQADPIEALDGLSLADLRQELSADRLHLLAGPDAAARHAAWARANLDRRLSGPFIPLMGIRERCHPAVADVMPAVMQAQDARAAELRTLISQREKSRSQAWIRRRFAQAPGEPPLRILIPTCRYTTFLQHAGRDLADAFTRLGCAAQVLIEPDASSQMSSVAYLQAMADFDPDLVILINYTRSQLEGVMPAGVPIVTWVQDMMPHLFTRESGASLGPLDLLAGHCGEDLFTRYGYPRDRAVGSPVVASESKFHPDPVPEDLRQRFTCHIACVTHHSETVDAMHARLLRESAADPDAAAVLTDLLPICRDVAARAHDLNPWSILRDEVARIARRRHRLAGNPDVEGAILRSYAVPVADRAFRHLGIEWAARIADRRGWTLRLYGKGWDKHPTLSRFSAGLTEHGEELRACYQCALVNLHLCLTTLMHQRPMECALSGGLPIVRPTRDALAGLAARAQLRIAEDSIAPIGIDDASGGNLYSFADTPEGMRYASMAARLCMPPRRPGIVLTQARLDAMRRRRSVEPLETDPTWLLGDLPEVSFIDESSLELLIARAAENPEWRARASHGIAQRVRERLTHTALARRLIRAIADRAGAPAAPAPLPEPATRH